MCGTLYIVATPIGNLQDITLRALELLKSVEYIACEDTRVTKRLLDHYGITTRLMSFQQHSSGKRLSSVISLLEKGKSVAYVTDAGTPGISDPGHTLVAAAVERFGGEARIVPIPGPSAVVSALSVSGFSHKEFCFRGFVPHKKGRQKFLRAIKESDVTVVFYESVHRIEKLLDQLAVLMPDRQIVLARELTKQFETIYRGTSEQVKTALLDDTVKGEFVVVVQAGS